VSLSDENFTSDKVVPYITLEVGFGDENKTASDEAWATLFPGENKILEFYNSGFKINNYADGDGEVALTDSMVSRMDLPPSLRPTDNPHLSIYLMAGFHQLHCLVSFSIPRKTADWHLTHGK
jgi:hypothetical protein